MGPHAQDIHQADQVPADTLPWRFAYQHLIALLRRWQETEQCSVCLTLPFCDACLLKGFVYHKAASRWLGKLHGNVSGTQFFYAPKFIKSESHLRVNPSAPRLIPTICPRYNSSFQLPLLSVFQGICVNRHKWQSSHALPECNQNLMVKEMKSTQR